MSLFSLKRLFDREAEIVRLRKANASLSKHWLEYPMVTGRVGDSIIHVSDPGASECYVYKRVDE